MANEFIQAGPKALRDMIVTDNTRMGSRFALLTLHTADCRPLPEALPGQFVQVAPLHRGTSLLRRPISINYCDARAGMMQLLIADAGRDTHEFVNASPGDRLNILTPLGNGWPTDVSSYSRIVLIGGGVGTAPVYFYGKWLRDRYGLRPVFVLAARSAADVLLMEKFREVGDVYVTTDDGSLGTRGFASDSEALTADCSGATQLWCVCGPAPMMKAVAAKSKTVPAVSCCVSLENMMACGLGACLCCVEKTVHGNVCVCTYGPVFDLKDLTW